MHLIFGNTPLKKKSRKLLVIYLISVEILGILVLIWFLRTPLIQKFLLASSKTYSVVSMNPKKQYLLKQGDLLTGSAIPKTKVGILLVPSNKKTFVESTDNGSWYFQIPQDIDPKKYHLSIVNFDKNNKVVFLKTYRFRVTHNNKLNEFFDLAGKKLAPVFKQVLPNARAQSEDDFQIEFGENFSNWATGLSQVGIYIYCEKEGLDSPCEDGADVFLTNYDGILSYCNFLSKQCLINPRPDRDIIAGAQNSSEDFITRLIEKTDENNYNITVLTDYFPELVNNIYFEKIRKQQQKGGDYKNDISESDLAGLIQQVVNDLGWNNIWWDENFGDPVKTLISLSDPILGTKAIIRYFEVGNFNKLTYEEQNQLLLSLAFLPIPSKAGKALLGITSSDELIRVGGLIRNEIQEGAAVPVRSIWNRVLMRSTSPGSGPPRLTLSTGSPPISRVPSAVRIMGVISRNFLTKAWQVDPEHTHRIANRVIDVLMQIEQASGKQLQITEEAAEAITQSKVYVVEDEIFKQLEPDDSVEGFSVGDLIILNRRFYDRGNDVSRYELIAHEMVHLFGATDIGNSFQRGGFVYQGPYETDRIFTGLYELVTDFIADQAVYPLIPNAPQREGHRLSLSGYPRSYPDVYEAFYERIINLNDRSVYDFMEFAITKNAIQLAENVETYPEFQAFVLRYGLGDEPLDIQFIAFLKNDRGINPNGITNLGGAAPGVFVYPAVKFDDFFTNTSSANSYNIQITSSFIDNNSLRVVTAVSKNRDLVEDSTLTTKWYLEDSNQNRTFLEEKEDTCLYGCDISLPADLNPGDYQLIVELFSPDNPDLTARNSTSINFPALQSANSPAESAPNQAVCEYEEWETEYECKDGQACYNLFYSSNATSCQPESRIENDQHYKCIPEERCNNLEPTELTTEPVEPETQFPQVPVDGVE